MTTIVNIILIGLILFFGGIRLTSYGIKHGNFEYFKELVDKIIKNEFIGIIIGIILSIALNNSSLLAVSVLLLVNHKLITGRKAFGMIAGSTIALEILSSVKLGKVKYVALLLGVALLLYIIIKCRKKIVNKKAIVSIALGYIIIIISLNLLKYGTVSYIRSDCMYSVLVEYGDNFIVNILVGIFLSGLSWNPYYIPGFMITLATVNILDINASAQIMIGSCLGIIVPVILSSIMLNKEVKKISCYYLLFELLILIFTIPMLGKYTESVLRIYTNQAQQICTLNFLIGITFVILILIFTFIFMITHKIIWKIRNKNNNIEL
ncbi:Na/Pi symporter [Clostridium butyricum]|uniref:Na/Pi symporter n=1 Tax=Clostridium butyricum TaxID=1492 RepID=UPI003D0E4A7E